MNKFFKWLVLSSENPKEIALTIRGIIVVAIPGIVELLNEAGVHILEGEIAHYVIMITALFGAVLTVIGLIRKLYNTFGEKEVVAFKAMKKKSK